MGKCFVFGPGKGKVADVVSLNVCWRNERPNANLYFCFSRAEDPEGVRKDTTGGCKGVVTVLHSPFTVSGHTVIVQLCVHFVALAFFPPPCAVFCLLAFVYLLKCLIQKS